MQEIIRRRLGTGFVGRRDLLARFQENFALPPDDPRHRFLFNVFGDPGVGKTFLLRRLEAVASHQGARSATVDDRVFDVPGGTLKPGSVGDVTIVDVGERYQVTNTFRSKASNSPFIGETLHGRVVSTVVGGALQWDIRDTVRCTASPKRKARR